MIKVCPYFKNNRCTSKHCLTRTMKMSEFLICATEEYIGCLVYAKTTTKEKKIKN